MLKWLRKQAVFLIIPALILTAGSFQVMADDEFVQENDSYERMAVDLVLVRPLGFVATVLGTAVFIVSLPFSAAGGNAGEAFDKLVRAPAKHTFTRPLGQWETEE